MKLSFTEAEIRAVMLEHIENEVLVDGTLDASRLVTRAAKGDVKLLTYFEDAFGGSCHWIIDIVEGGDA